MEIRCRRARHTLRIIAPDVRSSIQMLRNNLHVQITKHPFRRVPIRLFTLTSLALYFLLAPRNSQHSNAQFRIAVESCGDFTQPVKLDVSGHFATNLLEILLEVDHVFVLGVESCATKLTHAFSKQATCIVGRNLDACAPKAFIQGSYMHAMKVSFTHAVVLYLAEQAQYGNIAVIEDDVVIRRNAFSKNIVQDFRSILHSNDWSILRVGFRPYFLEESSRGHCPAKCRCEIKKQVSTHFCKLSRNGCDMRSSDFYVIRERYYLPLRSNILDLKQVNSKRIVDTHPMRYIAKQWLLLPQMSFQKKLDIPVDYQIGLGTLYMKKCVHPRPLPRFMTQLFNNSE